MSSHVQPVSPAVALPALARVLNCQPADLEPLLPGLTHAWVDGSGGAAALRVTPGSRAELLGGVAPGEQQHDAALALLSAAQRTRPQLYAYAEPHLLPESALHVLGWGIAGQYTGWHGPLPVQAGAVPTGITLHALSQLDLPGRMAAQRTYADRIGHTVFTEADVQPGAGGANEHVSRVALTLRGEAIGVCRAWLDGPELSFSSPGVHADWRGTSLRSALLLSVCRAARSLGATYLTMQAWGDTPDEHAQDLALGLHVTAQTPIYAPPL